jgi:hypothetical protein
MPGDPKECRLHAMNCLQLSEEAIDPKLKQTFVDLAQHWNKLAVELEDAQVLLNTLNALGLKTDSASPPGDDHDPCQANKS